MKRFLTALVLLTGLFGAGGAVWAGDFDKGMKAYRSGDYATALKEWRPLAEQGNADAQSWLGVLYRVGLGVLQDPIAAHMWNSIAAANGNKVGGERRERIAANFSPSELAEARMRAKRCMESKYKDCEAEPKSWWQKLLD